VLGYREAVATQAERATSFGTIAEEYNRLRSGPPDSAIEWLLPAGCRIAVDLAAGTGLLARALAGKVSEVVAVEPDERMRAVLHASSDGVGAVAGLGEALPLQDASVDGLFISSAWHWLDHELATGEIGRVLRDGGRFGVIWTSRDREVGWVRDIDWIREPGRYRGTAERVEAADGAPGAPSRRRVILPEASPFTAAETATFSFTRTMAISDFVSMIATYSGIITASEADRAESLGRVRAALEQRFPGATHIDVPMRSLCWRATRSHRALSRERGGVIGDPLAK